jgi:hypothetical protein
MVAMGLNHLARWIDQGITPPRAPPIAVDAGRIVLDETGNAKGGVRNPYVDVPVAMYGVPNGPSNVFLCAIAGWRVAYSEATLHELYRNKGAYISQLNRRLMELVPESWMLPEYAEDVRTDAQAIDIPNPSGRH